MTFTQKARRIVERVIFAGSYRESPHQGARRSSGARAGWVRWLWEWLYELVKPDACHQKQN
ncbi:MULTISPECIES: hypothetical protein [unclassified Cyanobium]|uniref:hypothetical protein n=1 Tax=unclassified Cyanobium TaxID=2627006 RepID=UPI0020CE6332|nr:MULTISPECIES: hypothetical protein [unclassified Cyanobium]MCP9774859.1 hypothetical protein [Cyanobium sp. WAJ14-Wanaka]